MCNYIRLWSKALVELRYKLVFSIFQMSSTWQDHVQSMMAGGAEFAAIGGQDGAVWAKNDSFNITFEELRILCNVVRGGLMQDSDVMSIGGIPLMKLRYVIEETFCIFVTKQSSGQFKMLCAVYLTSKAVIVVLTSGSAEKLCVQICENEGNLLKSCQL